MSQVLLNDPEEQPEYILYELCSVIPEYAEYSILTK